MARENRVLKVGDKAPDFALPDALTGETVRLTDLLGKPLLVYFGRGTWCPTCRKWMSEIEKNMPELEKRGARAVAIMAQDPTRMQEVLKSHSYPFPVLADVGRKVVKEYGVYVRANFESINIARPANFVLDAAGAIRFIHISSVQIEFAAFGDILATLDAMQTWRQERQGRQTLFLSTHGGETRSGATRSALDATRRGDDCVLTPGGEE
ncbi:MAG: peroxiredoxin family protein [bacterium]